MREPDAIKLFVGQVPREYSEKDLQAIFEPYGDIHSLNLLQDKTTGQHKGCAFLTYYQNESAKAAQESLHEKKTLPGARHPMQVKPAASETSAESRKLFLGMLPRNIDEVEIRSMFETFGTIEDLTILKNNDGKSKGCAFIKYETRLQAQNAIKTMHNSKTMEGCNSPIVVKLADTEKDKLNKKRLHQGAGGLGMTQVGGIGQLQQTAYYQQLLAQMALPQLIAANPNLANPGAPGAMGALVAAMATQQAQPVEQQPQLTNPTTAMQNPLGAAPGTVGNNMLNQAYSGIQQYISTIPQAYNNSGQSVDNKKEGPEGANLFIYQIPSEFSDSDLMQTFMPFGNVISSKVFIDKTTQMSKGFGFVSYDNVPSANNAIEAMNGFVIGTKRLKVQVKRPKGQDKPY